MAIPTAEARKKTILAAQAAADKKKDAERVRLLWKSSQFMATVVEVPLTAVVLNPKSHRIRAQLESAAKREIVARDPYSEEAQEVLADLLRNTDRFDELKDNLNDVGQSEPGVITHTGLLVNANTRCVALRDLRTRHIRVAVLPEDASDEEIDRLELRLQMQRDFRRDYSFTNELLFLDDLVKKYKYKDTEIALEMGWSSKADKAALKRAAEQVQQNVRMLGIIRELQHLSKGALPLTQFDATRQAILELDEDYERKKRQDPEGGRRLRETRLVGILANVGYRELREIDETFLGDYLVPSMEEQPAFQGHVNSIFEAPPPNQRAVAGLEVLNEPSVSKSAEAPQATALLEHLAESAGGERVVIRSKGRSSIDLPRGEFVGHLKSAIESAAEDAREDRQQGNLLDRPRLLIKRATKQVKNAIEAYKRARARPGFDMGAFRAAIDELSSNRDALVSVLKEHKRSK